MSDLATGKIKSSKPTWISGPILFKYGICLVSDLYFKAKPYFYEGSQTDWNKLWLGHIEYGQKQAKPVDVIFGSHAKKDIVPERAIKILKDIARTAGVYKFKISSTARDADDQARAMYNNIVSKGVASQKDLYGSYGDKVIDVYVAKKAENATAEQIKAAMSAKITEVGPGKVSRHAADQSVLTVVDIAPSSVAVDKRAAFVKAVNAEVSKKVVSKFLHPGNSKDPAYHIEIPVK